MNLSSPNSPVHRRPRLDTARRFGLVAALAIATASCSTLDVSENAVEAGAEATTTTYVTLPPTTPPATVAPTTTEPEEGAAALSSTTAVPTTAPATTAAPTTAPATTVAPTTAAPTTAPATTVVPSTVAPTTTVRPGTEPLEELPYTGPSEAVLFGLIGLAMIVVGRSVLDVFGLLTRVRPVGSDLPPR